MINVSKHNILPISYTSKPQHSISQEIHLNSQKAMGGVAPREDVFHSHSLNILKPDFNYLDKPSIIPNVNHPAQRADESEISIFDAEKYFNGTQDSRERRNNSKSGGICTTSNSKQPETASIGRLSYSTPKQSISSISRLSSISDASYGRNYRARSSHASATPTASSEASWNSQTGLLIHPPCLAPISIRNLPSAADRRSKKTSAPMKWFLRGNRCPCSGKKSVNVEESNASSEASKTPTPTPPRIVRLNRITSSADGYIYSSRQRNPKALPQPVRGMAKATLIPDETIRNFIARPELDQSKLIPTNTNPCLEGQQRESNYQSDRFAVTVRTFADGSGTTSNGFTFPILSKSATPSNRMFNIVEPITGSTGDIPRESFEIFQPQDGRNLTFTASPKSRRPSYEEEMCSDASSDLFEIESFSTTTQSNLFARQDSLDDPAPNINLRRLQIATHNKSASSVTIEGLEDEEEEETVAPSIAPTECYPPSEVSVDWSVTTAEGFDRASRTNFSVSASEVGYGALRQAAKAGGGGIAGDGESKRRGNGGLLTSCRGEKAVNVGPNPIKYRHTQRGGM